MEKYYTNFLAILLKLIDEKNIENLKFQKDYFYLEKQVDVLSELLYNKNCFFNFEIVENLKNTIFINKINILFPFLIGKTGKMFFGMSYELEKIMKKIYDVNFKFSCNKNLPMVVVPANVSNIEIGVVNYKNQIIELTFDEYIMLNTEFYKENIDINKIIKCFVVFVPVKEKYQYSVLIPQYSSSTNDIFLMLNKFISNQILVSDNNDNYLKQISKLSSKEILFIGNDIQLNKIRNKNLLIKQIVLEDVVKSFKENVFDINFVISEKLLNDLLKINIYYKDILFSLSKKINEVSKNLLYLDNYDVKEELLDYQKELFDDKKNIENWLQEFDNKKNELILMVEKYEECLWQKKENDIYYTSEEYQKLLLINYFNYVYCENYNKAKENINKLKKIGYNRDYILLDFINYKQGFESKNTLSKKLQVLQKDKWEILKIYFEIVSDDFLEKEIEKLPMIITGKEYYYLAKNEFYKKRKYDVIKNFCKSLELGYEKSEIELSDIVKNFEAEDWVVEELAEKLIAEANYIIGKKNIKSKYKKGIVNLKIATSKKHENAMNDLVDILYDKYEKYKYSDAKKVENVNKIKKLIELYEYLNKINRKEIYNLKIGIMYYKIEEYTRSYQLLKDLNYLEAQYTCALMYQYGNGVPKDLKIAKSYYEKMKSPYLKSEENYKKICDLLNKKENIKNNYREDVDYSSRVDSYENSSELSEVGGLIGLGIQFLKWLVD